MARHEGLGRAFAVILILCAALTNPVAAQDTVPFPSPVVAPVDVDAAGEVALRTIYRDPSVTVAEPVFVVELTVPVAELPVGTEVALSTGSLVGDQRRMALVVDPDGPRGTEAVGAFDELEPVPSDAVVVGPDGSMVAQVDPVDDNDLLWAELTLPGQEPVRSPVFPFGQLSGVEGFGVLTPARVASVYDAETNLPTGEVDLLAAIPTLQVLNQSITVRTTQPVPVEALGVPVVVVRDYLRVATDFSQGGRADHLVVIDHGERTVVLYETSPGAFPVPVETPTESWLLDGLTDEEIETSTVEVDRAGFLSALGLDDDASVAIGVARTVALDDGRYLSSDGPMGTLAWFDEVNAQVEPPPVEAPGTTAAAAPSPVVDVAQAVTDDSGPDVVVLLVAGGVALLLMGAAMVASRRGRRDYADPDTALGAMAKVVDATSHESDEDEPEGGTRRVPLRRSRSGELPGRRGVKAPSAPKENRPLADTPLDGTGATAATEPSAEGGAEAPEVVPADEDSKDAGPHSTATVSKGDPDPGDPATPSTGSATSGKDALFAAMRRRVAEPEGEAIEPSTPTAGSQPSTSSPTADPSSDPPEGASSVEARTVASPSGTKTTRPDDALEALLWEIDNLPMPDENSTD